MVFFNLINFLLIKFTAKPDLLVVEEEYSVKALTPQIEEDISAYVDPFDTSIAENIVPGKAELKVLESELIPESQVPGEIKRSYTDPDFDPRDDLIKRGSNPLQRMVKKTLTSVLQRQNFNFYNLIF